MNAHGRVLNRVLLCLLGLAAFAIAAVAGWPLVTGSTASYLGQGWQFAQDQGVALPVLAWIIAAVLAVAVIGALAVILTRPPRRIRAAMDSEGVVIDTSVVEGLFASALSTTPDVLGVSSSTALRRGRRTVALKVQVRPRADLVAVVAAVSAALESTDRQLGERIPLAVQLTSGIRATFARDRRVE